MCQRVDGQDVHDGPYSPRPDLTDYVRNTLRELGAPDTEIEAVPEQVDCDACRSSINREIADRSEQWIREHRRAA